MGNPRGIPADLVALFVPVTAVGVLFSAFIVRAMAYDPEITRGIPEETDEKAAAGQTFRMHVQQYFRDTPRSILPNDFSHEVKKN